MNVDGRRRGPAPAVVTGALAEDESAVRVMMTQAGYPPSSVAEALAAMRHLSGWMNRRGLAAAELTPLVIDEFLAWRRRRYATAAVRGAGSPRWSVPCVSRALHPVRVGLLPRPGRYSWVTFACGRCHNATSPRSRCAATATRA